MRIAVTGGTGFTGQRIVAELRGRGYTVVALVRPSAAPARPALPCEVVAGTLQDPIALDALLDGADAFVHAASLAFGHAADVVAAARRARVARGVFFSSTSIFTRLPAGSRAERAAAEARVRESGMRWTLLRPTMIYGAAGDRNMWRLIRFVSRTPVVLLPDGGRALVQPVHVDDLATAAVDALESARAVHGAYDLPGAEASPLRAVVEHVARLLGRRPWIVPVPLAPAARAAAVWSRLGLPPRITAEQVWRLGEDKAFSLEPARLAWGYAPRSWREGLAQEVTLARAGGPRP